MLKEFLEKKDYKVNVVSEGIGTYIMILQIAEQIILKIDNDKEEYTLVFFNKNQEMFASELIQDLQEFLDSIDFKFKIKTVFL